MTAKVEIEAGICGFHTIVEANSADFQNVTFTIQSDCEKIRALSERLKSLEPFDAYMEIHPAHPGILMKTVSETTPRSCAGCVVPVGIFKGMQVAAGLSLPRSIAIKIEGSM